MDITTILDAHSKWCRGDECGVRADLQGANLQGADLQEADLRWASLRGANLRGDNLQKANLQGADLQEADLRWASLQGADLQEADLRWASLQGANLQGANLTGANLQGANLTGADLPHFSILPEEGGFYAWKKTTAGVIKIYIPSGSKRTSSLTSRKCRAEYIKVISGIGCGGKSPTTGDLTYNKNSMVYADKFDEDVRIECTHGIHFFMTKQEAEEW